MGDEGGGRLEWREGDLVMKIVAKMAGSSLAKLIVAKNSGKGG